MSVLAAALASGCGCIVVGRRGMMPDLEDAISLKKLDAAIDALVDALAELPEHELEGWQRGNRLGLRILCELARRYPSIVQATGPVRRKAA
jgi:citrate lyase beta subunit